MQLLKTQPEATTRDMPMSGRQQKGDIDATPGGKKKAACRGDQVAEDDPRLGNEQIVFDHFMSWSHHAVIQVGHDPDASPRQRGS